jgi:Flp pilus assembly protein TadG
MGGMCRRNASSGGQTLVEFALIAPILFIFLFGIIDFGMALNRRIVIEHAVREGSRYAAVHLASDPLTCTDIQDRTAERAGGKAIQSGEVSVHCFDQGGNQTTSPIAGDTVRVTAPFKYELPLVSVFGVSPIDVTITGEALLEGPISNAPECGP